MISGNLWSDGINVVSTTLQADPVRYKVQSGMDCSRLGLSYYAEQMLVIEGTNIENIQLYEKVN